uniref:Uncharacterized protein n=1 Tax=viral metagenome TaxID=1070528 RepID=A0A6C0IW40_9ZZZZ
MSERNLFNQLIIEKNYIDDKPRRKMWEFGLKFGMQNLEIEKKKSDNKKQKLKKKIEIEKKNKKTKFDILNNHRYIDNSDKDTKKRIYYNIIENDTQILSILLYILMIIHIIYKACLTFKTNVNLNDIKQNNQMITKYLNKIRKGLLKLNIDITKNLPYSLVDIIKYYHNQSINYYKQYVYIYNVDYNNNDLDKHYYKNVPVFQCNDNTNNYENSILDKNMSRYLSNIEYQKEKFNFYQTICQPLNISDDLKTISFYNNQRMGNKLDNRFSICRNGKGSSSQPEYNYVVNTDVNQQIKYNKDIYLPKFLGDKYISYNDSIIAGLNKNPIDIYTKLFIDEKVWCPPPPEQGDLDIDKQIKKLEKLRNRLFMVINKQLNLINRIKVNLKENSIATLFKTVGNDLELYRNLNNIFNNLGINLLDNITKQLKYNCSYNFKKETINIKCK